MEDRTVAYTRPENKRPNAYARKYGTAFSGPAFSSPIKISTHSLTYFINKKLM